MGDEILLPDFDDFARSLAAYAYRFGTEEQLQDDVETALVQERVAYVREHEIAPGNRIDFYLPNLRVGIECKVDFSHAQVAQQLIRYAQSPLVAALVLVSRKRGHALSRDSLGGKPFRFVWCGAGQL